MAVDHLVYDETLVAAVDLTGKRYYGVKLDVNGQAVLATAGAVYGVLQDENIAGRSVPIRRTGTSKVILGGNVANGDFITTDGNGKFVKITPGAVTTYALCMGQMVLDGGVLNDISQADVRIPTPLPAG